MFPPGFEAVIGTVAFVITWWPLIIIGIVAYLMLYFR